jgi:glycosyltransferase involved in cell wall biosynthesis/peptidoglycan/xylan/chitin deacetylase (PgdA/CDA1 family)
MKKVKVLYIIDVFYKLAGAEKNLFEVVSMLNKEKYEPVVLCLQCGDIIKLLSNKNIEVFQLDISRIYSIPGLVNAFKLYSFIKKSHIDIIVTYHEGSDYLGAIVGSLAGVPIIISSRRDMGYRLHTRHVYLYRMINRFFDRVLAVSDAVKDIIFERENVPYHKIITVHNGVDTHYYDTMPDNALFKKKLNIKPDRVVVGILAGLRPVKGHKYFLEAASLVVKQFPSTCFLVAGPADDVQYFSQLKSLVHALNIEDNVIFSGEYTDNKEILAVIDISVISSLNEGFSNSVLESMAASKPVVATNTGGTPEAVIDGITGILVAPGDSPALAEAILRLMKDTDLRQNMGNAGRQRVVDFFDSKVMMTKTENMYEVLLASKANRFYNKISYSQARVFFVQLIKMFLGGGLKYSGISFFAKRTSTYIKILAYHRVVEDDFDPLGMNITPQLFESQLRYLKEQYAPISLQQAVDHMLNGKKFPHNAIVLTFDDGYLNNYTHAFPLLKKYAIPGTIFLATNAVENREIFWYDKIVNAIKRSQKLSVDLCSIGMHNYRLHTWQLKYYAAQSITEILKYVTVDTRNQAIEYIVKELNVDHELIDKTTTLLSWEDIKLMSKYGISFGSHGMSHSILTTMSLPDAEREIDESKRLIEERIGKNVLFFAYPNGHKDDFNEDIAELVKKCGYLGAVTLISGKTNSSSPYTLNRYCIDSRMLESVTGGFSSSKFEMEMVKQRMMPVRKHYIGEPKGNKDCNI